MGPFTASATSGCNSLLIFITIGLYASGRNGVLTYHCRPIRENQRCAGELSPAGIDTSPSASG
jgi:hypothetical protein